jgi:hypothetical protein
VKGKTMTETATIENKIAFDRNREFTIDRDFSQILDGKVELPNVEDVDPLEFLSNLASGGHSMTPKWGWSLHRPVGRQQWTQFFLRPVAMGGQGSFDGSGYAVIYGGQRYDQETRKSIATPIVVRFAICKHEKVDGPGANHIRGWHPGHCKHCGLNMTVDSGD